VKIDENPNEKQKVGSMAPPKYGNDDWCASRQRGANQTEQAKGKYKCSQCSNNVHKECNEIEVVQGKEILTCAWCNELEDLQFNLKKVQDIDSKDQRSPTVSNS
jgi:DNA-directed RNA polymerase subunit RPC12/RpoP